MPVSARYQSLRDRTVAAVDQIFAEPLLLIRAGGGDPVQFEAVLRTAAQVSQSMAGGRGQAWQVDISGSSAVLYIDRTTHPAIAPKQRDEIKALSRVGQPYFEIARVDDRNAVRLICYLTESAS